MHRARPWLRRGLVVRMIRGESFGCRRHGEEEGEGRIGTAVTKDNMMALDITEYHLVLNKDRYTCLFFSL